MKLALTSLLLIGLKLYSQPKKPIDYVNPFIGTQKMGHVYPGATVPFGGVQLSPDTKYLSMFKNGKYVPEAYEYCAGYQYNDSSIYGFSHTHFSGTGHSDLGDILVQPLNGVQNWDSILKSNNRPYHPFSHKSEKAAPGYYSVELGNSPIKAELTASTRVGIHKYTFPGNSEAHLLLDLVYNIYHYEGKNIWSFVRVENDSTITGYRQTSGWGRTRTVYFAIRLSEPIKQYGHEKLEKRPYQGFYRKFNETRNFPEMAGEDLRLFLSFGTISKPLVMRVALSSVSMAGAVTNLQKEAPHNQFDHYVQAARKSWELELSKVEIKANSEDDLTSFYTALYHSFLTPVLYSDVDGSYRGLDQNNHQAIDHKNYTIFSLWDTYRALHPWFNLVQAQRNDDMIKSMIAHAEQSVHGMLPIWSHYANENWCMIGYHAVSVLADALISGSTNVPADVLLKWAVSTSRVPYFDGLDHYMDHGYVAEDKSPNSVSKTLEYAYNDWCIAQIARLAGDKEVENQYLQRAENYRKVFDQSSGFMRPRLADGQFRKDFDPFDTHGQGFIEGNAFNYGLYVPHKVDTMIAMMGGKKAFVHRLDSLFTMSLDDKYIEKNEDITRDGILGAYVHGNEPGHHIAYLYTFAGQAHKTQYWVRTILEKMYLAKPDGLCGNDDAGQMSAWYLFNALGFYPFLPGSGEYVLASPLVKEANILIGEKTVHIVARNQGSKNKYVKKISWNGSEIKDFRISHQALSQGGTLEFIMSSSPFAN